MESTRHSTTLSRQCRHIKLLVSSIKGTTDKQHIKHLAMFTDTNNTNTKPESTPNSVHDQARNTLTLTSFKAVSPLSSTP
jgi:hypothetical protein